MNQRPTSRRDRGFSLAELMVVIAIGVTLLAFAVPTLQSSDRAGAQARRMLTDAARMRTAARTRWEPTVLDMDFGTNRWQCRTFAGTPIVGPDSDANGWRESDTGVALAPIAGKDSTFVFLPNGRVLNDSGVRITSGNTDWDISADVLSGRISSVPVE